MRTLIFVAIATVVLNFCVVAKAASEEEKFLELLNQARITAGLQPLDICDTQQQGARSWSVRMRSTGRMFHGASNENIAHGATTAKGVFRLWMNSKAHREYLMSPKLTACGIAKDGSFWTFRGTTKSVSRERTVLKTRTVESGNVATVHRSIPMEIPQTAPCTPALCVPKPCVKASGY